MSHVDPQVVRILGVFRAPDFEQQLALCHHFTRVLAEQGQELEFDRREVHLVAVQGDLAILQVHADRAKVHHRIVSPGLRRGHPTQGNPDAGQETKAKYPLREARVTVVEVPGSPGSYSAVAHLRPWLQMEELTASLRMVARIPAAAK